MIIIRDFRRQQTQIMDQSRYQWIARLFAATLVAYAFAHSVAILLCQALIQLLHTRSAESVSISTFIGLAVYIVASFFCFATKSIKQLWVVLSAGIVISLGLASLLDFSWGSL